MTDKIRLQKFLAQCGLASRRKAEEIIAAGRVKVNGVLVTEFGVKIDPSSDTITVDGKRLQTEAMGVLIFHKPENVITTRSDTHNRKTVTDFFPEELKTYFPVGRLDRNTTGLLILTNDGDLADMLLHPRYQVPRTYIAEVEGILSEATISKIQSGFKIEDGPVQAAVKCLHQKKNSTLVELTLHIGRKRVVRRMMGALGHPVLSLKRTVHGPFYLGDLPVGAYFVFPEKRYQKIRKEVLQIINAH